jgi:hypothetical protein
MTKELMLKYDHSKSVKHLIIFAPHCITGQGLSFHDDIYSSLLLALLPESRSTFITALEARENALGSKGTSDLILEESDHRSNRLATAHAAQCCNSALMRYWSPEYCDWRVALVTEAGEEVCTILDIFFSYFSY